MAETSSVTIRVDAEDKRRAEQLFGSLGLDISTAFNMFIKQSLMYHGLPFDVSVHGECNDDYFYSEANLEHLNRSIAQIESGKAKPHELIEVDDND